MGSSGKAEKKEKSKKKKEKERKSKDKSANPAKDGGKESDRARSKSVDAGYRPISELADNSLLESYFQNGAMTLERFKQMTTELGLSMPDAKLKSLAESATSTQRPQSAEAGFVKTILEKQKAGVIDAETCIKLMNMFSGSETQEQKAAHTQYVPPKTESYFVYPFHKTVMPSTQHHDMNPSSFDDTDTALLRRDYANLKGVLEAAFAPRIEQEIESIKKINQVKAKINAKLKEVEEEAMEIVKNSLDQTRAVAEEQIKDADSLRAAHESVLKRISKFMKTVSGPKPRDALSMDLYSSPTQAYVDEAQSTSEENIQLDDYYRQFVQSQMALKDQQVHPHPLVMRDFVVRFEELKLTAHKLAAAPVVGLGSKYQNCSFDEALERLSSKQLCVEVRKWKERAESYNRQCSELEQRQKVIYSMVAERETYEKEKLDILNEIQRLSDESTKEVSGWVKLHETTTRNLTRQIAKLQEENRLLKLRLHPNE